MADGFSVLVVALASFTYTHVYCSQQAPNIVVILADDLGWNDVSFHGSDQIPTPNIDALAYNGIILNNHYVPALCTPSRSAFMTGKYPIHTGMQHLVILEAEPWGLPLRERILPQHLKKAGYATHAIGKWHLGFFRKDYTPLYRGFDSHFGYYQGFQDYYNHSVKATFDAYDGYDMHRNLEVDWSALGKYSTDLFTEEAVKVINEHKKNTPLFLYLAHLAPHTGNMRDPFQAPYEEIAKFSHIQDPERRVYAAMVSRVDRSVGEVVSTLSSRGMLENSIILFMTDNGGPTFGIHSNRGSNFPLRGIKETPWEGGVRGVAAVWSPLFKQRQQVSNQLMYMTDWLPTFYSAAGKDVRDLGEIDGIDMWGALVNNTDSPRTGFVYNIDDVGDVYAAIRQDDWKYLSGTIYKGIADGWYGETGRDEKEVSYDPRGVLRSKVGLALSGFITKQQIKSKTMDNPSVQNVKGKWKLLREDKILALREAADLSIFCVNGNDTAECNPLNGRPCLFNIKEDPCETDNLAEKYPEVLQRMEQILERYRQTVVPTRKIPSDPDGDPALWNGTWISWKDEIDMKVLIDMNESSQNQLFITAMGFIVILLSAIAFLILIIKLPISSVKSTCDGVNVVNVLPTNKEDGMKRLTIDWDVPRFTALSDLITAQVNLQHYEQKLQEKKETSSTVREELKDGWRRIRDNKEHLKSAHKEFDKLGSQEKKDRTKMRHVNEKKLEENLEKQIEKLQEEVLDLRAVKEEMDKYYKEYKIFPDYLKCVVEGSNDFDSVQDVINRYETLIKTQIELKQQLEENYKDMVDTRAALQIVLQEKSTEVVTLVNKLVELSSRADVAKNERMNWQLIVEKIKTAIADKYLENKLVRTSCWTLYKQMCRQRKIPEIEKEDDIDEQLVFIKKTLLHYKRVVRIATNDSILYARSYVPNSSDISVNVIKP